MARPDGPPQVLTDRIDPAEDPLESVVKSITLRPSQLIPADVLFKLSRVVHEPLMSTLAAGGGVAGGGVAGGGVAGGGLTVPGVPPAVVPVDPLPPPQPARLTAPSVNAAASVPVFRSIVVTPCRMRCIVVPSCGSDCRDLRPSDGRPGARRHLAEHAERAHDHSEQQDPQRGSHQSVQHAMRLHPGARRPCVPCCWCPSQ